MECPSCQTANPAGQKFCGSCGQRLVAQCHRCQTDNPAGYKFCGQCGADLTQAGALTLARSGLITHVNEKALEILGRRHHEVQGKPFSLFVVQRDLVVFFSHLNELQSSAETQRFEINLQHKERHDLHVKLECAIDRNSPNSVDSVHIAVSEVADNQAAKARLQHQQELLGLVFTMTHNISTAGRTHLRQSIVDALKKVCLFTKADICFICSINRTTNRLDALYDWRQEALTKKGTKTASVPLARVKRTIIKLRQEKVMAIADLADIEAADREELLSWHQLDIGSMACYLIYSGKIPTGVIGVAKQSAVEEWPPDSVSLVTFLGDFVSDRLPASAAPRRATAKSEPAAPPLSAAYAVHVAGRQHGAGKPSHQPSSERITRSPENSRRTLPDMTRPMLLEPCSGSRTTDQQPVFPRDDGLVLLTCPRCGIQEPVAVGQFEKLGNAVQVSCPCRKQFLVVLEKRRFFRKSVRLDGYFSIGGDLGAIGADGSIWGPMIVEDLSRAGLRFSSQNADLARPGDMMMVRFNLDNSNRSLIHKAARVVSVTGNEVGCKFEGADSYDITLGFYFM